jgi:dCMP deaminase
LNKIIVLNKVLIDNNMKRKIERHAWSEYYMFNAFWAATRSSCSYLKTGAVIIKDKRIIAIGYNGAPSDIKNCLEVGCRKDKHGIDFNDKGESACRGIHAEKNAMNQISRENLKGTTMYTVFYPCSRCAKEIVGNGFEEIVYSFYYKEPESLTKELFSEKGIKLRKLELNVEKDFNMIKFVMEQKRK